MSLSVDSVDIKKKIDNCKTLQELEVIRLEYLGKKGLLPAEMKLLGKLPIDQKKIKGQELNKLKTVIEVSINDHKILIENAELEKKLKNKSIDVTLPHTEEIAGKIHPISQTIFRIIEIFGNLNYSVEAGPDIESDFLSNSAFSIKIL
jgi:phenylalanyl-tRNA synthetase alpha chain